MPTSPHVDVAAYVLGILDAPDDVAYSQHFARCPRCRAEFRELSDLPRLLDQVKPNRVADHNRRSRPPAAPGKQVLAKALEEIGAARQTRRSHSRWLAAAAAVVVLAGASVAVWQLGGNDPAAPVQQAAPPSSKSSAPPSTTDTGTDVVAGAHTVRADNPVTGVGAIIGVEPQDYGTRINLELRGVLGPMQCQLVAVDKNGASQVVTSWSVPAKGFGVPDSPEPLRLTGNVGFDTEDILRFDIRRDGGGDLLVVPA
jgi:hypothetical protein